MDKILRKPRLIPVPKWPDYHDYPTIAGLRHLIFHRDEFDFSKVLVRVNKRILINEDAWFAWLEERNGKEGRHGR